MAVPYRSIPGTGVAQGAEGVVGGFAVQVADPYAAEPAAGRVVPEFEVAGPGELAVFGIVEVDAVGAGAAAAGFEVGVPGLGDLGLDGALPLDAGDQGAVVGVDQALAVVSVDALQAAGGVVAVFDGPFRGIEGAETAGGVPVESAFSPEGVLEAGEAALLGAAVVPGEAVGALFGGFAPGDLQGPAGGVVGDPHRGLAGGADLEGPVAVVETGGGDPAEGVGVGPGASNMWVSL